MSTSLATLLLCALSVATATVFQIKLAQGLDPTSMVVTWSTNGTSSGNSQVIYGTVKTSLTMLAQGGDGKSYTFQSFDAGKYVPANAGSFFPKYTSPLIHSVDLNNLVPGTTYYYRCGDVVSSDLSGIISFTTLPAVGSVLNAKGLPLTFAVLADTSTNGVVNGSLYSGFMNVTSLNILTNTAVGMVLLPGDLSYADCNAPVWDLWDTQNSPMTQTIPFMVSAGNHEQEQEAITGKLYTAFEARYVMPHYKPAVFGAISINGKKLKTLSPARPQATYKCQSTVFRSEYDYGNSFYSFNTGLAHVIFLNGYTNSGIGSNQYNWLLNDLKSVNRTHTPWIVVNFHTPWYNTHTGKHNELVGLDMKRSMEDLFYKYKVNVAFSGHVHAYERFLPIYKNVTTTDATIYMTVGTGGQSYDYNKWVTQGPGLAQEPYTSVNSTKTGIIYGYGTFTINSATVATWNMYRNDATKSPKQTTIDSLLICNTFNTGSAICPYTAIPTNAVVSLYSFIQLLSGVTVQQSSSFSFQTAFVTTTAAALGIPAAAVTITAVSPIATRRLDEDKTSRLRALSASTTVAISYYVSTAATRASTQTSIANSGPTLANSLNAVGATNGFTASVGAVTSDFSTSYPTSDSAYSPRVRQCFAGTETVQLESGDIKAIADIVVGDRVLAANALGKASFSEVVYLPHKRNKHHTVFAHITTEDGNDIKMTLSHVLPAGRCGSALPLVYASKVTVGDCIQSVSGQVKVAAVERVHGSGVYTIVTNEEFVVVNGIIASPFGANHMLANMYYNVHRFLYSCSPILLASSLLHSINEGLGVLIPLFESL